MKVIKKFTNVINRLRGVMTNQVSEEGNSYIVCLNCECQGSLSVLAACLPTLVESEEFFDIHYHLILDKSRIKELIKSLNGLLEDNPDLDEHFSQIDNFHLLDKQGKKKYFRFIKTLRKLLPDGFFDKNAQELLDWNRHCGNCEKPLFSKEDEMNVVLEFDCPFEAVDKLDSIQCESENEGMKSADVWLHWKQGDEMRDCLEECDGNVVSSLRLRKEELGHVVNHLDVLAQAIEDTGRADEFEMDADTHMIMLSGPDELIDILADKELVQICEDFDEE